MTGWVGQERWKKDDDDVGEQEEDDMEKLWLARHRHLFSPPHDG